MYCGRKFAVAREIDSLNFTENNSSPCKISSPVILACALILIKDSDNY